MHQHGLLRGITDHTVGDLGNTGGAATLPAVMVGMLWTANMAAATLVRMHAVRVADEVVAAVASEAALTAPVSPAAAAVSTTAVANAGAAIQQDDAVVASDAETAALGVL